MTDATPLAASLRAPLSLHLLWNAAKIYRDCGETAGYG